MAAGWITLIGAAERNKRQKEACLPSRSLQQQQGRGCEASVVNRENAEFHPRACSLFIYNPQRHQRLSHSFWRALWVNPGCSDPGMGNVKPHRRERLKPSQSFSLHFLRLLCPLLSHLFLPFFLPSTHPSIYLSIYLIYF